MTIKKPELHIINNTHQAETMAELKNLLDQKHMTQADLALALKRDKTTINRWTKNSREITWDNAIKIAEVLGCHPVDIMQPRKEIILRWHTGLDCKVKTYPKEEQYPVVIPYDFYNKDVKAIQYLAPGTFLHREIFLFNMPNKQANKFHSGTINKLCFLNCAKSWKKKVGKCDDIIGIVKTNDDGTLKFINPITRQPINKNCEKFDAKDIDVCVPVKAKYNPDLL